ncbi:pyruvate kinase [Jeotgalibacillus soli]|uniref:Pyruvate kinase n=1 Tax=Jeotgalibacillus soli TaxID=889306 RepID=A0A0C2VV45_9BACL|nr:pyruvate kinase [Jeotgalibacillus soli]KIL48296.1 pyruvate kinase [Jeotgalibacillus soli]
MTNSAHELLRNEVLALYERILTKIKNISFLYPNDAAKYSAQNLVSFLIYKEKADPYLIKELYRRGFMLTSTQDVLNSMKTTCLNLGMNSVSSLDSDDHHNGSYLSQQRAEDLFGKNITPEQPHIMVTLDVNMISSSAIKNFLLNGMTIARINCAYHDAAAWGKLIGAVRHAEEELRRIGHYKNRHCKIFMDLAGPKIRVGPIKKGDYPLHIKVKKDPYGTPLETKIGLISLQSVSTKEFPNSNYDFILSVHPHVRFHELKKGNFLYFYDARKRKRKLVIIDISPAHLIVRIGKSAFIDANTRLLNDRCQLELQVNNIEKTPLNISVKKGDRLSVYLDNQEGHPATLAQPAGISVSLPKAFEHVKVNDFIFIDDGKIEGKVIQRKTNSLEIDITSPDTMTKIKEHKGINLPDSNVSLTVPALTIKDQEDLAFISKHADIVGLSFVHHPRDLRQLKQLLHHFKRIDLPVIAKIETKEAIYNFSNLLLEGLTFPKFGIMVARGDLAIEIGFNQLAVVQQEILNMCRAAHIPVILATQVLETLAKKSIPSRSELADLSFASQFDCIMLNKGPYMEGTITFLRETLQLLSKVKDHNQMITRSLNAFNIPFNNEK